MPKKKTVRIISHIIHWLLVTVLLVYLVTGLAIEYNQVMEFISFGFLTKLVATKIHNALLIPFVGILIVHIIMVIIAGKQKIS